MTPDPTPSPQQEPVPRGSLTVEIRNGPTQVVFRSGLTTEWAVEEVCSYLPVIPATDSLSAALASGEVVRREKYERLAAAQHGGQTAEQADWMRRTRDAEAQLDQQRQRVWEVADELRQIGAADMLGWNRPNDEKLLALANTLTEQEKGE